MNFLEEHEISFISDVKANRPPPIDLALFVTADRVGNRVGKGQTSQRQMRFLQRAIREHLGLEIEWIVRPSHQAAVLESALFELLAARYPGAVRAVIISSPLRPVSVWVEPNPATASWPGMSVLETLIKDFLKLYNIEGATIHGDSRDLPAKPMILRTLKVYAPVKTENLAEVLREKGATIPSSHWLQAKLDGLRKQGLIIRSKEGEYALTELGLGVAPHGKNRLSSDIERALAFGRRKW
jgi:hypothetical protein